jgi:hypothetical protein
MQTIELHQAFFFICDDCGRDNFARGDIVSPEKINPSEIDTGYEELTENLREYLANGGTLTKAPDRVTCGHCGAQFQVACKE